MYDIYYSPFRYVSPFEVGWLGEMFKWACAKAENRNIEEILSYLCLKKTSNVGLGERFKWVCARAGVDLGLS